VDGRKISLVLLILLSSPSVMLVRVSIERERESECVVEENIFPRFCAIV